jgi:undecaprenyl-diphosphatase
VSSSGHLALVPRLLGWEPPDKGFEVALHAGSLPAVALALRGRLTVDPLTLAPPVIAGALFERPIERRLGGVRSVALAQVVAGLALLAADLRPESRSDPDRGDRIAVGLAQAAALVPGVSRSGAALTVARWRGLSRKASLDLSLRAALPVTAGAVALKAVRGGMTGRAAAVGAAAACLSGLAALPLARSTRWRPVAAYRVALGAFALARAGDRT